MSGRHFHEVVSVEDRPASRAAHVAARATCLLLSVAVLTAPVGADDGFRVEPVGVRQGLSTGIVTTVFVDRHGSLWAATRDGLIRFDGYSTTVFSHDPSDPTSISDNVIRTICEDRSGRLWIGTNTGGLNLFDRSTLNFTHYRHDSADRTSVLRIAALLNPSHTNDLGSHS